MVSNEQEIPEDDFELDPQDFFKAFYWVLVRCGGVVSMPQELLDKAPENATIVPVFDEGTGIISFVAEPRQRILQKRRRGIITPN